LQGGKPSKGQAAAAREAPEHKAMPTRFYTNVLLLLFWQAQLMTALTQLKSVHQGLLSVFALAV
jgi:hypothetical protein